MSKRRYVATVKDVEEVTLRGSAAYAPWEAQLTREGLTPARREDGRAQLLIVACASRYMGISFRECSLSVAVSDDGNEVFLAAAYNSSRMFAWSERRFFHTPYEHADVDLDPTGCAHLQVVQKHVQRLGARMGTARDALDEGSEHWEGTIHIPRRGPAGAQEVFHGKLEGMTRVVPFDANEDEVDVDPQSDGGLRVLAASDFRGETWHLRQFGVHARSKTFPRA